MKIATSILNAKNRLNTTNKLNHTQTTYIHIDVMDGKFVTDTQFNKIEEISEINSTTNKPLDIHLMVENPIEYIENLENMNIEFITFHFEIEKNINEIIKKIKSIGYKVGISIKPNTNIEKIKSYLENIDLVLIMSVEPGKGGQQFLPSTIDKINKLKEIITKNNYNIEIEVDGGINNETISKLEKVDIAVVGSYIINSNNYHKKIEQLLKLSKNK